MKRLQHSANWHFTILQSSCFFFLLRDSLFREGVSVRALLNKCDCNPTRCLKLLSGRLRFLLLGPSGLLRFTMLCWLHAHLGFSSGHLCFLLHMLRCHSVCLQPTRFAT